MLRTFGTLLAIRICSGANRLIYYSRKLPLVGKYVQDTLYAHLPAKRAFVILAVTLVVLWGFLSWTAYLGILVYMPTISVAAEDRLPYFLHIFFLLSFVTAGISNTTILEPKREKYIAVKLMRLSPARYMKMFLSYRYCLFLIYALPAMLVFASMSGASAFKALLLALSVTLWRVFCEYLHLRFFARTGIVLVQMLPVVWTIIIFGYAAAYGPLLAKTNPFAGALLLHPLAFAVIAIAGVYAAVRLARHDGYAEAVDAATRRDDPLLDPERILSEALKADMQTSERDDDTNSASEAFWSRRSEGYSYLNRLFFARHRRLVSRPVYTRLALIGAMGAAIFLWSYFRPEGPGHLFQGSNLSGLALISFLLSVGDRICQGMFYQCDISLMRYGFYRKAADRHFRIRLGILAVLNLVISAAFCAMLTAAAFFAGEPVRSFDIAMLWASGLSLSVLFSVHHLFVYYYFQPYASERNTKNPFYYVLNYGVSSTCGACFFLPIPPAAFTVAVVILTVVYTGFALVLVRKCGSRTFIMK